MPKERYKYGSRELMMAAQRSHQKRLTKRNHEFINRAKARPCADCGVQHNPWVMQFDHRNPQEKQFELGCLKKKYSLKRIQSEIAKCDVVCANCHFERTHRTKAWLVRRDGSVTASTAADNQLCLIETFTE